MMLFLLALFLHAGPAFAANELEDAVEFLGWLEKHATEFASCEPTLDGANYLLCDKTSVPKAELKKLFKMKAAELLAEIKGKGITVEVVCAKDGASPSLAKDCRRDSTNKAFAEVSSLHGKYLPEEKTILIRNSASTGSLVHEYIHSLQSVNKNEIYGKTYKKRRIEIQRALDMLMSRR